jgi:hypothetical protein
MHWVMQVRGILAPCPQFIILLPVEELREDSSLGSLKEIFSLILAIGTCSLFLFLQTSCPHPLEGNYLNGGTNKGQAHGIKLNGLVQSLFQLCLLICPLPQLKLVECRRNGSKTETLLHQVVKFYRLTHTDEELFYSQWINVWAAKNVTFLCLLSSLTLCLTRPCSCL